MLSRRDILRQMSRRDAGLDRLLDLDGFIADVGGGFWVKIVARRVPPDADRPYGVSYTLTLHAPTGKRAFGIDNAHLIRVTAWASRPFFAGARSSASGRVRAAVHLSRC